MELFTSLTQAKMALQSGELPPMTPVPVSIQDQIDPDLTIGMGALIEDPVRGLRCPVRGCGQWHHNLGLHVSKFHGGVGGMNGLKKLLDIPRPARLISTSLRKTFQEKGKQRKDIHKMQRAERPAERRKVAAGSRAEIFKTTGAANLRDQCVAQLSKKLTDLEKKLGRPPTGNDFQLAYGSGMLKAVTRTFGSFTSAKAQCGMQVRKYGHKPSDVYAALREYYLAHRRLPTVRETYDIKQAPIIPSADAILPALGFKSWPEAMKHVAMELGVYDSRYRPNNAPSRVVAREPEHRSWMLESA